MESISDTQRAEAWRPAIWLIGIMLLVHGVSGALSRHPLGIWHTCQSLQQHRLPMEYVNWQIAWMAIHFLLAVGMIVAGVGLWRQVRWAQNTAIVLLGCWITVFILGSIKAPKITAAAIWSMIFPVDYAPYWQNVSWGLERFSIIPFVIMFLFLTLSVLRQELGEQTYPGLFTRLAAWCRRQLPSSLPPLLLFMGLLFICRGAPAWSDYFLHNNSMLPMPYPTLDRFISQRADLITALAFLVAGVGLVQCWRWGRQTAIFALTISVAYDLSGMLHSFRLALENSAVLPDHWPLVQTVLQLLIGFSLQLVVPVIMILLVIRNVSKPAPAEGVGEAVPEG